MRRAARIDENQPSLVAELRKIGATVWITSAVGQGAPDLVIGWCGRNWLFEVKDPSKIPSKRKLTPDEANWHENWLGQVDVIETAEQAIAIMREG